MFEKWNLTEVYDSDLQVGVISYQGRENKCISVRATVWVVSSRKPSGQLWQHKSTHSAYKHKHSAYKHKQHKLTQTIWSTLATQINTLSIQTLDGTNNTNSKSSCTHTQTEQNNRHHTHDKKHIQSPEVLWSPLPPLKKANSDPNKRSTRVWFVNI